MIKRSLKWLWYSIAALIIGVAVLVSVGRLLFPQAYRLKPSFENYLSERTGAKVRIANVHGAWRGFGPELRVEGIELMAPDTGEPLLTVGRFEAALDLPRSVLGLHAVMRRFEVEGLKALVELDEKGALVLPGLVIDSGADSDISAKYVIDSLLRQNRVSITQTEIRYRRRQGDIIPLVVPEVSLRNRKGQHQAIGELSVHEGGTAKFVLEFTDYPLRTSDQMTFYLESQSLDLARLPLPTAPLGFHLDDGDLQLEIWANWRDGGWRDGQANLNLKRLQLINDDRQQKQITSLGGRLHFARAKDDVWYLHGDDVYWQIDGEKQPALHIEGMVQRDDEVQRWGLDIGSLALADVMELVRFSSALPANVRQQLADLELAANLPRIQLDFRVRDESVLDWAVASRFEQLHYSSETLPVLANMQGRVMVSSSGGAARVMVADQAIDFHQLFRAPIALTALDLGLRWQADEEGASLTVPQLALRNADAAVRARAAVTVPKNGEPELALAAEIHEGVGANKGSYLPVSVMTQKLVDYLNGAIIQANVDDARAVLRGPLKSFPFSQHDGVFDVRAMVSNAQYRFQPDWPAVTELSAALQFIGNSMFITVERGVLAGWRVDQGAVVLDPMGGPAATLQVQAKGGGDGRAAFALLRDSPLREPLLPLTNTLDVEGALALDLALAIPLHDSGHSNVQGKVSFGNATMTLKPLSLPMTSARGQVEFAEYGVTKGNVQLQTLGGTVRADVDGDRGGASIDFRGEADSAAVASWYPHPVQNKLNGRFGYEGRVLLPGTEQQGVKVELRSELLGLTVQAPAPFGKAADEPATLAFLAGVEAERLSLYADYRQQLVFQAERNGEDALRSELLLGGTSYAGHSPGLSIRGSLDRVAAGEWIPFVADVVKTADEIGNAASSQIESSSADSNAPALALSVSDVDFYGLSIANLQLGGRDSDKEYELELRSPSVSGELRFAANRPIRITLDKFLHEATAAEVTTTEASVAGNTATNANPVTNPASTPAQADAPPPRREPGDWPQLEIDCKQCRFYSRDLGRVQISMRNQDNDKKLRMQAERNGLLTASLEGLWSAANHETRVTGRVASRDWGKLTTDWGVDLSVRQSSGHVDLDLRWPESPVDFRLRNSNGELNMKLGKGFIARGSDNAERVLRVFSLLSLQSITRRLSLDFSDLFRDGFYYDEIRGSFAIANGKAVTNDTMIDGVSAGIALSGETDFVARTLNQQIEVTPKLSSSLPILAGWAINPPAGLVVWLMNKLFIESAVKVVTGLQYTVRGPWDNPEVIERGRTEKEVPIPEEGLPEPGSATPPGSEPAGSARAASNPVTTNKASAVEPTATGNVITRERGS